MKAIAAVDSKWGIGKNGNLLVHIPEDMKYFRKMTLYQTVLMGRRTFESLSGPLKNRRNIVISKNYQPGNHKIEVVTLEEALQYTDAFVIGGGIIYKALLPYCDEAYITKIYNTFDADMFFPNLDNHQDWILQEEGERKRWENIEYAFCKYVRNNI